MTSEISFRLTGGPQPLILIPATVNGEGPLPFVLDTGAGPCLLTPELAARIHVDATDSQAGTGAGGQVPVQLGVVRTLAVGGARLDDVPVGITGEIHRLSAAVAAEIHGGIGYSFLRHFRMTVDYDRSLVRLLNDEDREGDPPPDSIGFRLAHPSKPLVLVPAELNDSGPYQFAIDTGSSTTVLSPATASSLGLQLKEGKPMTGGGGQVQTSTGRLDSIRVGHARVDDLTVMVADFLEMLSRIVGVPLDGVLGYNFLRNFRVTLDYPDSWLRLEPPGRQTPLGKT